MMIRLLVLIVAFISCNIPCNPQDAVRLGVRDSSLFLFPIDKELEDLHNQALRLAADGDYKGAARLMNLYISKTDSAWQTVSKKLEQSYDYQLQNKRIELENTRIEQQNSKMLMQKAEYNRKLLDRQQKQQQLEIRMLDQQLEKNKKELQTQHLKQLQEENREHQRLVEISMHRRIYTIILIGFIVLALIAFAYVLVTIRSNMLIKHAEAKAMKLTKAAQNADLMKSLFLQNTNHELRSPLSAIVGFSDLLCTPGIHISPEERKSLTDAIHANTDLLLTLMKDIIDLTTFQSGTYKLSYAPLRLKPFCQMAVEGMMNKVEGRPVLLKTALPEEDLEIETDQKRLLQVVNNLLSNACKFTEVGEVVLSFEHDPSDEIVRFSVTDTGCGVPKGKSESIFNRFEKVGTVKKGYGLGLSICQSVVTLMGGRIWLDTSYKNGARFCFELPIQKNTNTGESV